MEINKIKGNTYNIVSGTNVGVFVFKDRYALLIDTGNQNQQARKISEMLKENNMNPKYIVNTHHHIDHMGGDYFFKEHFSGSIIYTTQKEKIYIENDELFCMQLYGASPIKELRKNFMNTKEIAVDHLLNEGIEKINNEKFEIISLPGHTDGQLGIATRDGVCFLADSLMGEETLKKYKMPFLVDIQKQMDTYEKIESLEYDTYILSHSHKVYDEREIKNVVKVNRDNLQRYIDLSKELLQQPKTREELLEEMIILEELQVDFEEYHFLYTTIGAIFSYLHEKEGLKFQIENGKLYYYQE
ncbi:MBL fold metallo-hydrolase [Crassaminicella profunda]|uniref:MBL fold metallo-hydrolase n=1 Tax=Crassaminicella profunda TaxID=1286698 RepID=UPI001CA784F2|nr:MBL fold metallo-hydrolase [Crassaminicella profunda]QZY55279.1 MBL fold metallo-hydrolase [Crassaminicella profunda]